MFVSANLMQEHNSHCLHDYVILHVTFHSQGKDAHDDKAFQKVITDKNVSRSRKEGH